MLHVERERISLHWLTPPWVRHEHLARYQFARSLIAGGIVVDCACGLGEGSRLLIDKASQVVAVDLSVDNLVETKARLRQDRITYIAAQAEHLPVKDSSVGAVVSLETIEHLRSPEAFVREVARVLQPDGYFICSTPDRDVYSPGNAHTSRPWNRFHMTEFTQTELAELLSGYFSELEMFGQNPKPPWLVSVQCWVGRRLPWYLMVRANQALKIPRYLYDRLEHHRLMPVDFRRRYENVTVVCRLPRGRS